MKLVKSGRPFWPAAVIFPVFLLLFAGCASGAASRVQARTEFLFDTSVTITVYGEKDETLLDECFERARGFEKIFSAEDPESELYRLNHRTGETAEVSDPLRDAILLGLRAGELSGGLFDITIYPVTKCWDFRSGEGKVPEREAVENALSLVDDSGVSLRGNTVYLENPDTMIDLGAIAKGWISADLRRFLKEKGAKGALIDLGGNISVFGENNAGRPFRIGIQKPFSDRGVLEAVAELSEGSVISSGTYERYFTQDGVLYHHILSAETGFPAESGLSQVTLLGTDDALSDALSTVFLLTGREKAEEILRDEVMNLRMIFTDTDGEMVLFDLQEGEIALRTGETVQMR